MDHIEFDFIIVGKGLAGSILAHHLIQMNQKVVILDSKKSRSSSKVAAGLYNPITGRKMVKTWRANVLFPYLTEYYKSVEGQSSSQFFHDVGMYRPFLSAEEQNEWAGRSADENFLPFINKVCLESAYKGVKDTYGGLELKQAGFLDVPRFLNNVHSLIDELGGSIIDREIDYSRFIITEEHISYGEIKAAKVLFCDGTAAVSNPYFSWLPFKLVKGEIIELEMSLNTNTIINRGVFVIPAGTNRYKAGSTYDNNNINWDASDDGKIQIESKLKELINVTYELKGQYAGVRPATKDRKPFIGMHPKYKNVGIFSGLGAKGVSLAPYFANQFAHHLVNQSVLDQEVAIERYFKLYEE